jgi:hypothetical protein
MTSSTINNNLSSDYLESSLAMAGKPSTQNNSLSTFAQLLGSAASSSASSTATGDSSKTNSPNQMLQQMMASFKSNGLQSESTSFDPMSIA